MATYDVYSEVCDSYQHLRNTLSGLTNCGICTKPFSEPKLLTCGHIFCISCLERIFRDSGFNSTPCPTCKTTFYPDEGDVNKLPPVPFMNDLLKLIDTQDTEEYCSVCEEAKLATSMCTDCNKQMCDDCSLMHEKFYRKDSHTILLKSKIKDTSVLSILAGKTSDTVCDIHEGKPVKYLCATCNCLICDECIFSVEHQSHKKQTLETAAIKTRHVIKDMEIAINEEIDHREKKQQKLKNLLGASKTNKKDIEEKIKLFMKDVADVIYQNEKELIQTLHEICSTNDALIKKSNEECDSQKVMEESLLRYIRDLEKHGSNTQLVKESQEIKRRFQQLQHQQEEIEVPKEETVYVDFHSSHNVLTNIQTTYFGKVVSNAASEESSSDSEICTEQEEFVQDEYDDFFVEDFEESVHENDIPPELPPKIRLSRKPSFSTKLSHSATMPDLRSHEHQSFTGKKTTSSEKVLGNSKNENEVSSDEIMEPFYSECDPNWSFQTEVKVTGFDISWSRKIFIISNESKQCLVFDSYGARIKTIHEILKDPWDVAVGRDQRNGGEVLYISDGGKGKGDGTVREVAYSGHLRRNIGGTKMKAPRGVSLSRLGNIYVCDAESRCVLVLSQDSGKIIRKLEHNSAGLALFQKPTYISVCPNFECYVTDKTSHDVIILNESGKRKNTYTGRYRFGDAEDNYRDYEIQFIPAMSCSDRRNNVYIIDMNSHCLHILLSDGNVKEVEIKHEYYTPYSRSPPVALAFDSNQELWIASENGVVFRFPSPELQQKLSASSKDNADFQKVALRK